MTTRRHLLKAGLASLALAPIASRVEAQTRVRRIALLYDGIPSVRNTVNTDAFKAGLRELGYVEGRDYTLDVRHPNTDPARIAAMASELIASKVDLIVGGGTVAVTILSKATRARL